MRAQSLVYKPTEKVQTCERAGLFRIKVVLSYPEKTQQQAMKIYYSGVSGRGTGKVLGLGKNTVLNWIKKND